MSVIQERKKIYDKLITDFTAMTHYNSNTCFAHVQKVYIDIPNELPACEILPSTPNVQIDGIDWNQKALGFTAVVYELINSPADQNAANAAIDRLSNIEDVVTTYLQKIPHPLQDTDATIQFVRIDNINGQWNYLMSETGLRMFLSINFDVIVEETVKTLG